MPLRQDVCAYVLTERRINTNGTRLHILGTKVHVDKNVCLDLI